MAKTKMGTSVPNKHLYSRLSYLHQAAAFLGSQVGSTHHSKAERPTPSHPEGNANKACSDAQGTHDGDQLRLNLARHLLTDLRATSLKCQIRLSPAIKHAICKFCDTLLIEGETCTSIVENESKRGRKPWADVLVIRCKTCNGVKRFPLHASRQKRRPQRQQAPGGVPKDTLVEEHRPDNGNMDIPVKDH